MSTKIGNTASKALTTTRTTTTDKAAKAEKAVKTTKSDALLKSQGTKAKDKTEPNSMTKVLQEMIKVLTTLMQSLKEMLGAVGKGEKAPSEPAKTGPEVETDSKIDNGISTPEKTSVEKTDKVSLPAEEDTTIDDPKTIETSDLQVIKDNTGQFNIITDDGYRVICEGKDEAVRIIDPEGKETRIWGDPHVDESDGERWDFKNNSSFLFGENKITIETVPAGNGETFTSKISIYNGDKRITVGGIDKNKPEIQAVADDAATHDAGLNDGDVFTRKIDKDGKESWTKKGSTEAVKTQKIAAPATPVAAPQVAPTSTTAAKSLSQSEAALSLT